MTVAPNNATTRALKRVKKGMRIATGDDKRVLTYIARSLDPKALKQRSPEDADVSHLIAAADERLRRMGFPS